MVELLKKKGGFCSVFLVFDGGKEGGFCSVFLVFDGG